jgi:hypothetical protein
MAAQSQSEVESSAAQATATARAENEQLNARINELLAQLRAQVLCECGVVGVFCDGLFVSPVCLSRLTMIASRVFNCICDGLPVLLQ